MTRRICFPVTIAFLLLLAGIVPAFAQYGASLQGTVSDQAGAVVAGATVTVLMAENLRTGMIWKAFMANPETQQAMEKTGLGKRRTRSLVTFLCKRATDGYSLRSRV